MFNIKLGLLICKLGAINGQGLYKDANYQGSIAIKSINGDFDWII